MKTSQGLLTNDSTEVQSADQELMNVSYADQGLMNVSAGSMETSRRVSRPLSVVAEAGQLSRLRPRQRT